MQAHIRISAIFAGVVLFVLPIEAQTKLGYRHKTGDKWHLTSEILEEVFLDGTLLAQTEILNKISVEVLKDADNDGYLHNHYQISEKFAGQDTYIWSKEYETTYGRDSRGRISGLDRNSIIPPIRNVPVYPENPVSQGATWEEPGQECFDLEPTFGIREIVTINFTARYEYLGPEMLEDRNLEKIKINYNYNWTPDNQILQRLQRWKTYPVNVAGQFEQYVYWDPAVGKNNAALGSFSYYWTMNDDHVYTFKGVTEGHAVYATPMNKERVAEEFNELKNDGITIKEVPQGVSVTLETILFVPDKAELLPGEEEKLDRIASILQRISERDIMVVGHTAKIQGKGDGMELSKLRAQVVAQYFIDTGIRKKTQIVSRGMGNKQPIANNNTDIGRKKNRRVEIIILEN